MRGVYYRTVWSRPNDDAGLGWLLPGSERKAWTECCSAPPGRHGFLCAVPIMEKCRAAKICAAPICVPARGRPPRQCISPKPSNSEEAPASLLWKQRAPCDEPDEERQRWTAEENGGRVAFRLGGEQKHSPPCFTSKTWAIIALDRPKQRADSPRPCQKRVLATGAVIALTAGWGLCKGLACNRHLTRPSDTRTDGHPVLNGKIYWWFVDATLRLQRPAQRTDRKLAA